MKLMAPADVKARAARRAEAARRNRERMPLLANLVDEVRGWPGCENAKLVWGRDDSTGFEIGTRDAVQVHALDLQPREVRDDGDR